MKQAKYLIDDAKYHIAGIATSWDYDNRAVSDKNDVFPNTIYDRGNSCGVRVKRDFQTQTEGKLSFEILYFTELCADGTSIRICSSENETLFELAAKNGFFFFNGENTGINSISGRVRARVDFNLDKRTARLIICGKTAGKYTLPELCDISKVYIGTTGETEIKLTPMKIRLYSEYIANESFLYTESDFSEDWQLDGDFEIRSHTAANPQMDYTYACINGKAGETSTAFLPFEKTDGDIIAEAYILLPDGSDGADVSIMSGKNAEFGVCTKDNAFHSLSGEKLRKFTSNVWQLIRIETVGKTVTVKIDGKKCGTFDIENAQFDGIKISFAPEKDAVMCFTDILCEYKIDYPDYCPEPKQVRHSEYEIGINICNMWREGHHFGWDRITYFTDNTPLIGPYDEGLPEVADWEIKFMTEHGITFQHFCWYCPDPLINFPIKRSRMDNALRDGFMNARYSDKMKFIIMWENNTYKNTNPDDFKNYVWKYWCEYFFTDPRYLKIDNKPLVSLWSLNFISHWGGENAAKELVDFMNADIKNYGCDGIILMATASAGSAERYRTMSDYCDITYSYHFGKQGYSAEHQISCIDTLNGYTSDGMAPYMQTVSVGFNACPWHGAHARVPLASLDEYEKVLRYVKKHGDERTDDSWYNKIFMMSTWNEYGEGTYIMPSHLHGFGYLDKIREVFVPESGKCENLLPDENQQKRITYLRKPGRVMVRRLGYQKSEEAKAPNKTVFTVDFSDKEACTGWKEYSGTVECLYTGTSLKLTPAKKHEHYSLVYWGTEKSMCKAADVTHIRVYVRSPQGDSKIRFAFLTDTDKRWSGTKCEPAYPVKKSDEYTVLEFNPGRFKTWEGEITDIRIDNMVGLPFEIQKIEFLVYSDPEGKDPTVFVNGMKQTMAFDPIFDGEDVIASLDPGYGAFRALKLYHEFDAAQRRLTVASADTEVIFTENSAVAIVNGKKKALRNALRMRDGLPTLGMCELCDILGYRYTFKNKHMYVEA